MKRGKKILSGIMVILSMFAFSGCYLFPKEEAVLAPPLIKPPEISYEVIEVKRGDVEKKITGSGVFISTVQGNLFFKHRGGRIKGIHIRLGDTIEKGQLVAELDVGTLQNQIEQQKINLKKAQTRYNQVKAKNGDEYDLALVQYDIDLAKLSLQNMEREMEEAVLIAGMEGTVTYVDNNIREGDYVSAYQTLVRVADPTQLQLQYSGSNNSDFQLGMEVDVRIKENSYTGKVIMTPANVPFDAPDSMKNVIRIEVPELPDQVGMGDGAQIHLILDRREDVIVLPRNLVRNYMGRKYVLVLEDGLKKERDVEVGLESATQVEIVKGLEEGEKVITR